jgi:hypothetical protein
MRTFSTIFWIAAIIPSWIVLARELPRHYRLEQEVSQRQHQLDLDEKILKGMTRGDVFMYTLSGYGHCDIYTSYTRGNTAITITYREDSNGEDMAPELMLGDADEHLRKGCPVRGTTPGTVINDQLQKALSTKP